MEENNEPFSDMCVETADMCNTRKKCLNCKRPVKVCWCQFLPKEKLKIKTKVHILQHPYEESRCLQTAAMLFQAFDEEHCLLYRGKKFPNSQYENLHTSSKDPNSLLLFPSSKSVNIEDIAKNNNHHQIAEFESENSRKTRKEVDAKNNHDSWPNNYYNLFVLDGTWHHAKSIYFCNSFLHDMKQVKLNSTGVSKYTIRTQPTDNGLSTVESVALAISILEDRPDVYEALMKPLEGMCQFQMDHGAVVHHSKEHLLKIGLKYPIKNNIKKDRKNKDEDFDNDIDGDGNDLIIESTVS